MSRAAAAAMTAETTVSPRETLRIWALHLIALVVPVWLARSANLPGPPPAGWVQLWGVMLLITASLYLPGWIEPLQVRWPNIVGIIARFVLAIAYVSLGRGLRWFALYELIFAVALAWNYRALLRADLMSRP